MKNYDKITNYKYFNQLTCGMCSRMYIQNFNDNNNFIKINIEELIQKDELQHNYLVKKNQNDTNKFLFEKNLCLDLNGIVNNQVYF